MKQVVIHARLVVATPVVCIITAGTAAKDWSRGMTNEEAIQLLYVSIGYEDSPEFDESLRRAIHALKKQKPIKVGVTHYHDGSIEDSCRACYEIVTEAMNYCPYCGQKIDWSEE